MWSPALFHSCLPRKEMISENLCATFRSTTTLLSNCIFPPNKWTLLLREAASVTPPPLVPVLRENVPMYQCLFLHSKCENCVDNKSNILQGVYFPCYHSFWGSWAPPLERSTLVSLTLAGMFLLTKACMQIGKNGASLPMRKEKTERKLLGLCWDVIYHCRKFYGKHPGFLSIRISV